MKPARKQELRALIVDIRGVAATDTETHARVQSGALTQLTKAMYCDTEAWNGLKDHEQTFLRCCAASRQSTKAVLVGRSAARINGVWVVAQSEPVTLAVPSGQPPSVAGDWTGYTYRYMQLPIDDILSDGPLRYTNAIRTAVDIARERGVREGVVAFESVFSGHNDIAVAHLRLECEAVIKRLAGTKGIGHARTALAQATRQSDSPYETLLRLILDAHRVPYRAQVKIGWFRVDFLVAENVVVEVDGWVKYEDVPHEVLRKQRQRDDWLNEQGFEVLHIYTGDILGDEASLIKRIRRAWERGQKRLPILETPKQYVPNGPGRHVEHGPAMADLLRAIY